MGEAIISRTRGGVLVPLPVTGYSITIDSSKIDENLSNYPIAVKLTSSNFDFSKSRADAYDIRFLDNSNNLLDFEREYFDKTEELGIFHVNIPSISSSADTIFKLKYADNNSTDLSSVNNTWNNDYVMIQHMGTSLLDSTSNGNNGADDGSTVVDGTLGKARDFNGTNSEIVVNSSTSLECSYVTVSALVKVDGYAQDRRVISKE